MDEASLLESSAAWDASLSVIKRKASSLRQSVVVKDERICELEKQLAASQLQLQNKDQTIAQHEALEEELRNQIWKGDDDNFKLRKENVRLKSEEEKRTAEVEKWKELATRTKVDLEVALERKAAVEAQIKKMQEEIIGLSETFGSDEDDHNEQEEEEIFGSDEDNHDEQEETAPVSVQAPQEDVSERGRAVTDFRSPTRYEGQRSNTQPKLKPSSSSSSLMSQNSSVHHGRDPSKPRSFTCLCGSSFGSEVGLSQHVRYRNKTSSRESLKETANTQTPSKARKEGEHSMISNGKTGRARQGQGRSPKTKRSRVQLNSSSESDDEDYEEEDNE